MFLFDGEGVFGGVSLYFIAAFANEDGDLFFGGGAGDEIEEFCFIFLFEQIVFYFCCEFASIDGLACKIPVNENFRFLQNKRFLLVEIKFIDKIFLVKLLNRFQNHGLPGFIVHNIIGVG